MDKSRADFEAWAREELDFKDYDFRTDSFGYLSADTIYSWRGWQASRKQALEEAAQVVDRTANSGRILLNVGEIEMSATERRASKAILGFVGRAIRSLEGNATKETT